MKKKKTILIPWACIAAIVVATLLILFPTRPDDSDLDYGFHVTVPQAETEARTNFVRTAEKWLGCRELDDSHKAIIDLYNSHSPLAMDYAVKYDDEWCATFVSAVAIECGYTNIIPTECGCQRQIELFKELGVWVEADDYIPLPGDIIYYCWDNTSKDGDCIGWSDHVGIVVGTAGNDIKVIEGNYNEQVKYRYIHVNADGIRGYAVPNYPQVSE